ncbi:YolD-like family protein [Bacillus chungangensis]
MSGRIHYLDQIKQEIRLKDQDDKVQYIKFEDILTVEIVD